MQPATHFRLSNFFLALLALALLVVSLVIVKDAPVGIPNVISLGITSFMHVVYAVFANHLVEEHVVHSRVNPYRWYVHMITESLSMTSLLYIYGFTIKDSSSQLAILAYVIFQIMCSAMDTSVRIFSPMVVVMLYMILINIVLLNSKVEVDISVAVPIAIALVFPILKYLVQQFHLRTIRVAKVQDETEEDETEDVDAEQNKKNKMKEMDTQLDLDMSNLKRDVVYDCIFYWIAFGFQTTVTWTIISKIEDL